MAYINGTEILFSVSLPKIYKDKLVRVVCPESAITPSAISEYPEGIGYRSNDFSPNGMTAYIDSQDQDEIFYAVTEQTSASAGFVMDLGEIKYVGLVQVHLTNVFYETSFCVWWSADGITYDVADREIYAIKDGSLDVYRFKVDAETRYIRFTQDEAWTRYRYVVKGIEIFGNIDTAKLELKDNVKTDYIDLNEWYERGKQDGYEAGEKDGYEAGRKDFLTKRDGMYLFYKHTKLTYATLATMIDFDDTSEFTNAGYMFEGCTALTKVPLFDTGKVVKMGNTFKGCTALTSIPAFNTSSLTTMNSTFNGCSALTTIPLLNTKQVTSASLTFNGCKKLESIPAFDFRNCSNFGGIVSSCSALTEIWIKNIRANLTVGSGTSYGHLIVLDCLLHLIKEVINTGTAIKLTVGSANLTKLSGIYVKLVDITDEMRAEDEFIDDKYPFAQCESTDEGAMAITDYYELKNLTLA